MISKYMTRTNQLLMKTNRKRWILAKLISLAKVRGYEVKWVAPGDLDDRLGCVWINAGVIYLRMMTLEEEIAVLGHELGHLVRVRPKAGAGDFTEIQQLAVNANYVPDGAIEVNWTEEERCWEFGYRLVRRLVNQQKENAR